MNVNDTEIAWSILQKKGYQRTFDLTQVPEICPYNLRKCVNELTGIMLTGRCCSSGNLFHKVRSLFCPPPYSEKHVAG